MASSGDTYTFSMRRALLDPRTKLALLVLMALFCLAGVGGARLAEYRAVLSALPFVLMLVDKRTAYGFVMLGLLVLSNAYILFAFTGTGGVFESVMIVFTFVLIRLIPCLMMGSYTMSTTSVSEFSAAMNRMHVPQQITIPFSVMFRFFPTIKENAADLGESMRMRGIKGSNISKFIEYRLVPLVEVTSRSGDELSASALVRGLGSPIARTDIARIGFGAGDAAVAVLLVVAFAVSWGFSL
ncbi:energy-coupling factor transporter transmembrane component T [Slackia heliotrinireducens]|jgi:energy-coupling factor transport system permease protein|uniref:energy-coupling factor transporter transmembrane component T n=1 Tax=Slackia heliotrinireducens TaxID=84110 RepID=UPI0033156BE1